MGSNMITYTWKILEIFADIKGVKYYVSANNGQNTVESEGNSYFSEGKVNLPFEEIKETNLIDWLDKEQILENLEFQLKNLENNAKIDFPWLKDTFTPQV